MNINEKPHVVFVSHRVPYPPNKGEKIRTYHQIVHLIARGYNVTVVCPTFNHADISDLNTLQSVAKVNIVFRFSRFKLVRLFKGLISRKPLSAANFYLPKLKDDLEKIITDDNIKAVICTSSSTADYIFNLKLNSSSKTPKLIMDLMDVDSLKWKSYAEKRSYPMKIAYAREHQKLQTYEAKIAKIFNRIVLISDAEKQAFLDSLSNKIISNTEHINVIGNGVSANVFFPLEQTAPTTRLTNPTLIFVGVMDYYPNIEAVLWFINNVWPDLIKLYPNIKFKIAGMHPSNEIKSLDKLNNVTVTGFVDDITKVFHEATIFVAPFLTARGVQNKLLQSFSCGIPVVTSQVGAEGIDCTHNHDVLIANNISEYLANISMLLSDDSLYMLIRRNALDLVEAKYNWQAINERLVGIIEH